MGTFPGFLPWPPCFPRPQIRDPNWAGRSVFGLPGKPTPNAERLIPFAELYGEPVRDALPARENQRHASRGPFVPCLPRSAKYSFAGMIVAGARLILQ